MKYIILLFLVLSFCSYGQKSICVYNKKDTRLIRYTDSIEAWRKNENYKKSLITILDKPETLDKYLHLTDSLGFSGTSSPTTKDEKHMYKDNTKQNISHEYVTCFHSRIGDISKLYTPIIPKPVIYVYYIDTAIKNIKIQKQIIAKDTTKNINIIYMTQDNNGVHTDSSKILVVKPSFSMLKN